MGKIIAIANQKGGVGKTTTAVNLSACLSVAEHKTLLIDLDPQSNATSGFGVNKNDVEQSIYDVIINGQDISSILLPTEIPYLSLAPSNINLVGAEVELVSIIARETVLKKHLNGIRDEFEYIIIDCPPSLGILTLNSLTAADTVLIPIQAEYYALEGLSQLIDTVKLVQNNLNSDLDIEGILLTMYDSRLNLGNQVKDEIANYFKDKVFKTKIYRNVKLGEAPSFGKPIILYNAASKGSENYMKLAKEILNNG